MAAILLPYNSPGTIYFPLVGSGTAAFSTAGTGSLVGTNIQISKDGGAFATSTNTGTHLESGYYRLVLTTSELSAKQVAVYIGLGTLGTKVEHQAVFIHTYGSASAMYGFDFGTMLASQTIGTVTMVLGGTIGTVTNAVTVTGTPVVDVTKLKGTAIAGTQGTMISNIGGATIAELAQGQPDATPSFGAALMALYMSLRNPGSSDGTWKTVGNSAGTVIFKKALADDGTVYTEGSATAGP